MMCNSHTPLWIIIFLICYSTHSSLGDMDFLGDNNYIGNDPFTEDNIMQISSNYSNSEVSFTTRYEVYAMFRKYWVKFEDEVLIGLDRSQLSTYSLNTGYCSHDPKAAVSQDMRMCTLLFDGDIDNFTDILPRYPLVGQVFRGWTWWAVDLEKIYLLKYTVVVGGIKGVPRISFTTSDLMYRDTWHLVTHAYTCPSIRYAAGVDEPIRAYMINERTVKLGSKDMYMAETKFTDVALTRILKMDITNSEEGDAGITEILLIGELANVIFNVNWEGIRECPLMDTNVNTARPHCTTARYRSKPQPPRVEVISGFPSVLRHKDLQERDPQCLYRLFDGEVMTERNRSSYVYYSSMMSVQTKENSWRLRLDQLRKVASVEVYLNRIMMKKNNINKLKNYTSHLTAVLSKPGVKGSFTCSKGLLANKGNIFNRIVTSQCQPYSDVPWTRYLDLQWSGRNILYVVEEIVITASPNDHSAMRSKKKKEPVIMEKSKEPKTGRNPTFMMGFMVVIVFAIYVGYVIHVNRMKDCGEHYYISMEHAPGDGTAKMMNKHPAMMRPSNITTVPSISTHRIFNT